MATMALLAMAIPVAALDTAPRQDTGRERGSVVLRGQVVDHAGQGVAGADVFLLETLEGAVTGPEGRFGIETAFEGEATLVVRIQGYGEERILLVLPRTQPLVVEVEVAAIALEPVHVQAGWYRKGAGEAEEISSLDVVTTPGTHGDVLQAVAGLPGVQPVEEGAALYVRGGDVAETKVVLDGAVVLAPYRFESGLVSFGTFDPFDLAEIAFSSGGFGAQHGDALSGLLDLTTAGVPVRREVAAMASLAALAGRVHLPVGQEAGLRLTANRSSTGFMHRVNGHDTDFLSVPESRNAGGSAAWEYRRGGVVKLYGYDEWNSFSVLTDSPSYEGAFSGEAGSGLWVASVRDVSGPTAWSGSLAVSSRTLRQEFGAFLLHETERLYQARGDVAREVVTGLVVRVGAEGEGRRTALAGTYPETADDTRPDTRVTLFDSRVEATRWAGFAEATLRPLERLQVTTGLRRDQSSLTGNATWDPRVAAVVRLTDGTYLTGAWGRYHQLPGPLAFQPEVGDPGLPAMISTNAVAGLVTEGDLGMLRVEAYRKRQGRLAQEDRNYIVVGGGRGETQGVDLFIRGHGPLGLEGRASYGFIDAKRTDPNTGDLATSPFEIRHALTLVIERGFGEQIRLAGTYRSAAGRPHTPIVDAVRDEEENVWRPVYGPAMSARLPTYGRVDVTGQFLHSFTGDDLTVFFLSVTNLLGRENVAGLQYSADYSQHDPAQSAFRRTFYFGMSTTFPF